MGFHKKNTDGAADPNAVNADGSPVARVRLPKKWNNEQFALALTMLGANHIRVQCMDGVTRMGRIKGKIKKRAWIREGDTVIVTPGVSRTRNAISFTGTSSRRQTGCGKTGTFNFFFSTVIRPGKETITGFSGLPGYPVRSGRKPGCPLAEGYGKMIGYLRMNGNEE